jgi:phage N-6-adenine-methyltransferase
LLPIGNIIPRTESQARPLASLEPDEQREVWQRVITSVPETEITAARVQKAVDEYKQKPHVSYNSGNNEWYTPAEYIYAARDVMGSIDLDPASSELANKTVNADTYYTAEDDGLTKEWFGHVWMNPPYSSDLIGKFADKLISHYQNGDIEEAIVLVNNATETNWFQTLLEKCLAVCFLKRRVKFIDTEGNPSGAPLQGQAILYFGNKPACFGERFKEFGVILYHDC